MRDLTLTFHFADVRAKLLTSIITPQCPVSSPSRSLLLGRPSPDVIVGGLKFYRDSSSFFILFVRQLPSNLTERNSTKTCHMFGSDCDLKIRVKNLGYRPLKLGPKTPFCDNCATYSENLKLVFSHPLGFRGNVHTPAIARWKACALLISYSS